MGLSYSVRRRGVSVFVDVAKGRAKSQMSLYYILVAISIIKFNIPKNGGRT
jgi:hypothetical protein